MNKKIRIAGIIGALAISAIILTSPSSAPPIPEPDVRSTGSKSVEILATGLDRPWAIDFADTRIFITEKTGRIRVVDSGALLEEPLATLRVAETFGGGLLGIAAHPNFANNHFLYVYYTYEEDGKLWNKVLRITEYQNKLQDAITIIDKIPGSKFSNGGVIKFGPDSMLYIGTGSVSDSSHGPQDLRSLEGKILRLYDDGAIPSDNPFPNSPVFSYGHRNPQGMAWDVSENLYVTELGPSKNDEINLVISGKNYGWPEQECSGLSEFMDAVMCYDPSIEPGGI
ncbi:MAG: PQQ-dependent sugar dehydrogenase, partial [Nitrosopumilaceae archaeon]